jgi:hypothetical protein
MMLRKFHYADWDAKFTAVLNTSVVVGMFVYAIIDIVLILFFPTSLQFFYNYPKIRILTSDIIILMLLVIRYYYCKKDILDFMSNSFEYTRIDNGYLLTLITVVILIGSFVIPFFIVQYVKTQGIVFG